MKSFALALAAIALSPLAHAAYYSCEPTGDDISGHVSIECQNDECTVTGLLKDAAASPSKQNLEFEDCVGTRREDFSRSNGLVYFDVPQDGGCWAHYIRLSPALLRKDRGEASLVRRDGGDNHHWSGYQYLALSCELM